MLLSIFQSTTSLQVLNYNYSTTKGSTGQGRKPKDSRDVGLLWNCRVIWVLGFLMYWSTFLSTDFSTEIETVLTTTKVNWNYLTSPFPAKSSKKTIIYYDVFIAWKCEFMLICVIFGLLYSYRRSDNKFLSTTSIWTRQDSTTKIYQKIRTNWPNRKVVRNQLLRLDS